MATQICFMFTPTHLGEMIQCDGLVQPPTSWWFHQGLGGLIIAKSTTRLDLRSWKTENGPRCVFIRVFFHDDGVFFGRWMMFEVYVRCIFFVGLQPKLPTTQKSKAQEQMLGGFGGNTGTLLPTINGLDSRELVHCNPLTGFSLQIGSLIWSIRMRDEPRIVAKL